MAKVTLITGGTRSGKSHFALQCAEKFNGKRIFIATAQPFDEEMRQRIECHKRERGDRFTTIEAPFDLTIALRDIPIDVSVVLIDCLTVWTGNLLYKHENDLQNITTMFDEFTSALLQLRTNTVIVTNEVGMGVVPENAMARQFRDLAGSLNRKVAEIADEVFLCVCGISVQIKEENE